MNRRDLFKRAAASAVFLPFYTYNVQASHDADWVVSLKGRVVMLPEHLHGSAREIFEQHLEHALNCLRLDLTRIWLKDQQTNGSLSKPHLRPSTEMEQHLMRRKS